MSEPETERRVARAICAAEGVDPDGDLFDAETGTIISPAFRYYERAARAAIAAIPTPQDNSK